MKMYRILPLLLSVFFLSCQNAELETAQSELQEVKVQLSKLKQDIHELNSQIDRMHFDLNQLELENEMLKVRRDELYKWANKLRDGYGTGIWQAEEMIYPVFTTPMKGASVHKIISKLNEIYEKNGLPKVILKKVDGSKVYLSVNNSKQLTQQMGTSGASSYIQEIFFSVTSVNGIQCVDLDFEQGDHAFPGQYCK